MTRMTGPDCVVMCNLINTHTHTRTHTHTYIGSGRAEAKKRKKPHKACRRHVGNGGDFGGKRKQRRKKKRVGPVASNPDNLENNKESGRGHKVLRAQVRIVQVERVCPFCRV